MQLIQVLMIGVASVLGACTGMSKAPATAEARDSASVDTVVVEELSPAEKAWQEVELPSMVYLKKDSTRIVNLLEHASERDTAMTRMEYFGRQFLGIPYVAHTLETDPDKEELVINLQELDCTTFVETCAALSIADMHEDHTFNGFCKALCMLRYYDGKCDGYDSRQHYFFTWAENNEKMGLVKDIAHEGYPFTGTKVLDLHWMSTHMASYLQLKKHPEWLAGLKEQEDRVKGMEVHYVPKALLDDSQEQLKDIHNGDIIAIITTKDGLDTTHLGMAIWQDGKLHLMNASSVYHKVVLDSKTFYQYMMPRKANLGASFFRLVE